MAMMNFGLLNTGPENNMGAQFQRGMDEALLRKQAMEKFEADKRQREMTNQYNQRQQELLAQNYENDAEKIRVMKADKEAKRNSSRQESEVGRLMANSLIGAPAFKVVDTGEGFDLDLDEQLYQQAMSNMQTVSADQPNPMMERAQKMGISPEMLQTIAMIAEQDPKAAATLLGKATMERMKAQLKSEYGKPAKEDEFSRWMNMTPEQKQAFETFKGIGKKPLVDMRGASFGGNATLPDPGEASKTAGKEFGKFAQNAVESAQSAYDVANDVDMVVEGLKGMGGGPVAEFKAWAGKVMPAGTDWANMASMNDLAKTVQVKLAPTMRAAGSGATSDFEMKAFMAAIPSLSSTEQGRTLMAKYAKRVADRAQARAEVVNDIEQEGRLPTPKEIAQRMESKVGKSFFDAADRAYFGMKGSASPAQQAATQKTEFDNMPMPQKYTGKILRDSVSGKRYQSDGKNWKEVK